ncbi:MAG: class II D-tagatose-bisphosphate aldolase, non-catalytic subunit [Treponema sp.]|jgi:tagatose-1,6-bisphosphate aldolase non-catalytic subunit AgaZ/GatZ|nr:class II D-tagatose-bisphosphate aldolase, non-catalytic subunit [Treponema sp.]
MKKITLDEAMKRIYKLEQKGIKCTMLGIGPMSSNLIEASFLLANKKKFPLMFIASRNQVDADEFGGGYVCSWNQDSFAASIRHIAEKCKFDGLYYLCRDHGGPWQRDKERNDKLPVAEAMALGKKSFLYDLKAGFDLLHVDPTKIPSIDGIIPMDLVLDYTVELIEYCEEQRKNLRLPPVSYEAGTEETNGGTTSVETYNKFINTLVERLKAKNLPPPVYIVGNTGTLTRLTENVGKYNAEQAMALSKAARNHGVGLKEHNGDYLSNYLLSIHPYIGVTAANVAPEFGYVETKTYLMLSQMERYFHEAGLIDTVSDFAEVFSNVSIGSRRWKKWMTDGRDKYTPEQVKQEPETEKLIVNISGHYTFNNEDVKKEKTKMYSNLENLGINPHKIVITEIMKSIDRYVDCFNLENISARIAEEL